MSRIEDMVERLCPDGVPYRPLGEVVRIRNGSDYKKHRDGVIPVYGSGGVLAHIDTPVHPGPSVLIPRKGSLGNVFHVDGPFWTVDTIFYTEIGGVLVSKFLYHVLLSMRLERMNQAGGVPSQTQANLNRLLIPVPPLEIQREIVRVLDHFTQLEAELEAELEGELEARRQQYSTVRESLFSQGACVALPLGDLGSLVRGRRFTKADMFESGLPALHYADIYTRLGVISQRAPSHVRRDLQTSLRYAQHGDVVFAAVGETVEDIGTAVAWLGDEELAIHDDTFAFHGNRVDPRYLAHFSRTKNFRRQARCLIARGKIKRISAMALASIQVPTPSIDEQRRIANYLDLFDHLVNDLTFGLPAEIAARRKQYEYYRDKLLTFKELT